MINSMLIKLKGLQLISDEIFIYMLLSYKKEIKFKNTVIIPHNEKMVKIFKHDGEEILSKIPDEFGYDMLFEEWDIPQHFLDTKFNVDNYLKTMSDNKSKLDLDQTLRNIIEYINEFEEFFRKGSESEKYQQAVTEMLEELKISGSKSKLNLSEEFDGKYPQERGVGCRTWYFITDQKIKVIISDLGNGWSSTIVEIYPDGTRHFSNFLVKMKYDYNSKKWN